MHVTPHVFFIGAGPGDPDLLTVRALKLLRQADIVFYDALVSDAILDLIPRGARRISVGKRAGSRSVAQSDIDRMLVALAQPGRMLIRLKGGDPAIFARLAEEIAALRNAGIPFAIVPGITAASAAAAASGIPLTQRGASRRVQFVTAHAQGNGSLDLDWRSLADAHGTTVFYMARRSAGPIAQALIAHGLPAATPALLMSDVSLGSEMGMRVPLSALPDAVTRFPPEVPLIVVVGAVAAEPPDEAAKPTAMAGSHPAYV
jgi:uroporphyrin-III C-methyltransferase